MQHSAAHSHREARSVGRGSAAALRLLCRLVAGVADVLVDVFFTRFAFGFRLHFTYTHVA